MGQVLYGPILIPTKLIPVTMAFPYLYC